MIYIRTVARGEPEVPPLVKIYQYSDSTDELILKHSVGMVQEKLGKKMRINVNEAMLLYCNYIVGQMRAKKHAGTIEKDTKGILSAEQVMIGVPETLRTIRLDAIVDGRREWLTLKEPIPASKNMLVADQHIAGQ
jgi:urease gamma subunit